MKANPMEPTDHEPNRPANARRGKSALVITPGGAAHTGPLACGAGIPTMVMPIDAKSTASRMLALGCGTMPLNFARLAPTEPLGSILHPRSKLSSQTSGSHSKTISSATTSRQSATS
jgi:hypothetical protein